MVDLEKKKDRDWVIALSIAVFAFILAIAGVVMPVISDFKLGEIGDVSFVALSDGQVLVYNATSGNWTNANGTPNPLALEDLTDVLIVSIQNNQLIQYNSTSGMWENRNPDAYAVSNLTDVSLIGLTDGQILRYNATSFMWENEEATATSISTLTDVSLNDLNNLQIIQYNGTHWVNVYIPAWALSNLTDVSITDLIDEQILQYNSDTGKWENINSVVWSISLLSDVSLDNLLSEQFLQWNGAYWVNVNVTIPTIDAGNLMRLLAPTISYAGWTTDPTSLTLIYDGSRTTVTGTAIDTAAPTAETAGDCEIKIDLGAKYFVSAIALKIGFWGSGSNPTSYAIVRVGQLGTTADATLGTLTGYASEIVYGMHYNIPTATVNLASADTFVRYITIRLYGASVGRTVNLKVYEVIVDGNKVT